MSRRLSLVSLPGRWMAPLIMVLFAMLASGVNFLSQLRTLQADVVEQETRRLRERLSVEQSRLSFLSTLEDAQQVRRIIGGLSLHTGMQSAYLLAPDGRIDASIIRADIGRGFDEVMAQMPVPARRPELFAADRMGIQVRLLDDRTTLVGVAPFSGDRRLVTLVDLTFPKARLRSTLVTEVVRESVLLLALAGLLALLMHRLWFKRASRLVRTLEQVGDGQLQARAALPGRDELASIGNEVDRMAQRLQAQQAELRHLGSLVARSPVVFVEWSPAADRAVRFVSTSIEQWQHSPHDLVARRLSFSELVHPDDWHAVWLQSEHHRTQGPDEYRQEYRLRTGDGRWIWVEDRSAVDRDAAGQVVGITGILLDITVQKEALLAQREQAEQLRLFYDLPFIGMAISSPESKRWLQVNDRLCDILGYSREELLEMTWSEMTPSPDLQNNLVLLQQMKDGLRDSYGMHKRFVRKDLQLVEAEIEVRAVRDSHGRLLRLLSTVQDVTERSRANEALRRQTQLLEQAEAIAGLGSWSFDPHAGEPVWWSGQLYRNMGIDPAHGPPPDLKSHLALVHPQDVAAVAAFVPARRPPGETQSLEFRRHPDLGPEKWFRVSVRKEPGAQGGHRLSGTVLDITALRQAQTALEKTNAELEQRVEQRTEELLAANRELEAFSYTVSHDLKAPLRGIDGYSQLLQEDHAERLDDTGRAYLDRIRRGVAQMGLLISDLLAYSRMERRSVEQQTVELLPLVERVLEEYAADIERLGARIDLSALQPTVLTTDREGLAVILRNLIGNALKFHRPGVYPELVMGNRLENGQHHLWVKDNGVGFDMKYSDKIFGIFQRLQRSDAYPGTGVGLALVSKAAQRMGGRVWAESAPEQGATFHLELPA
ncbi:PAS domain S-box protein [Hydrogenophaga sp. IBVHS2]|uniref:PAS domain S-box protein n=1 Tax=Hydrogenophaga sp. IBVHS2 TaxID=1985170 RepID=UPI000A2E82DD|nr:PAS domain S-box protein [Hydrogenophaga sp. IBVHS2]OSZ67240.1 hypothetical protein CAP38_00155 [Hydrogenophaga sp. IBVHS2]